MPNSEMLGVVEDMARRLLTEEEVAAVMRTCRRVRGFVGRLTRVCVCVCVQRLTHNFSSSQQYVAERSVENLIRHLLVVLDRPEKLLLLREVR